MSSPTRIALLSLAFLSAPLVAFAQVDAIRAGVDAAATQGGIQTVGCTGTACIVTIIGNVVNIALSFLGVLLLCYLLYAGFLWTTAGGDSKKTDAARSIIQNAVIGLVLTLSAFAISNFVIEQLAAINSSAGSTSSAPATPTTETGGGTGGPGTGGTGGTTGGTP